MSESSSDYSFGSPPPSPPPSPILKRLEAPIRWMKDYKFVLENINDEYKRHKVLMIFSTQDLLDKANLGLKHMDFLVEKLKLKVSPDLVGLLKVELLTHVY